MTERVVVSQFGYWWTLSPVEWATILRADLAQEEWRLPRRGVSRRPKWIGKANIGGAWHQYPRSSDTLYYEMPCDWDADAARSVAWEFYDALSLDSRALVFPLCPWCGFECAMARNTPVPLRLRGDGCHQYADCPECEGSFVLSGGEWAACGSARR